MKLKLAFTSAVIALAVSGCATVPLESEEKSEAVKEFAAPPAGKAGLYVYRDSSFGGALKKNVYIDKECLGESAPNIFFYKQLDGDKDYVLETESEFSENRLPLFMESGENYFVRQYIKVGVFVGGANLEVVPAAKAKGSIADLDLAKTGTCG